MPGRRDFLRSVSRVLAAPWLVARARAATLIRNPYLQNVRKDHATIVWTTAEGGSGAVRFSRDRSLSRSQSSVVREQSPADTELSAPYYRHSVELKGLQEGTEYFFRSFVDGECLSGSEDLSFRTSGPGPFSFVAFGDSGSGLPEQRELATLMEREQFSLVTPLGDLAYPRGSFETYQEHYFDIYRGIMKRVPFFPCPGNHGYMTREAFPYLSVHELPPAEGVPETDRGRYYSFDWGNVHFVSLDSNTPLVRASQGQGPMLEWLARDLAATRQYWKIVYFHHPPYAFGPNEADPLSALARRLIVPILERSGVQAVLNGHEHSYQRSHPIQGGEIVGDGEGILYVTSGGGGAWLYPVHSNPLVAVGRSAHHFLRIDVNGARLTVRAIGLQGQEIDRVSLSPAPELSGAVNAATGGAEFAPGTLVSVFGRNFAPEEYRAPDGPLPEELGGVSLLAQGRPLPLLFASPSQINAQLPFDLSGKVTLELKTPNGVRKQAISIADAAPGIFAIAHRDGSLVTLEAPAASGEQLVIYSTGLGALRESDPPEVAQAVVVEVGGAAVKPDRASLTPGRVGLYQVSFRLPAELEAGQHTLRLRVGGAASNSVPVQVGARSG